MGSSDTGPASEARSPGEPGWDPAWREILWGQFGAAIDMLENTVRDCPEELWRDRSRRPEYWYVVYHTLFWLDLYLSGAVEGFAPPAPFTLDELDPSGVIPAQPYQKAQLLGYLAHGRERCRATLATLTGERARARCAFRWGEPSFLELLVYNLRHVQHHAGQLHLILRQETDSAPGWVGRAGTSLGE